MKKKCWMLTMVAVLTLSVAAMFTGCSNKNDATTTEKTTEGGSSTTATNNDLGDDVEDAADVEGDPPGHLLLGDLHQKVGDAVV